MSAWSLFRQVRFDGLMYITNRIVARMPSHHLRNWFYRRIMRFEIGPRSSIFMDAWFDTRGNFRIGSDSVINQRCRLDNRGGITIGDNVSLAAETCVLTADHDVRTTDNRGRERPIKIDDYAFVGTRAMILPGVTIGRGAVVAAGAVVTRDVEPYTIVAGVPAKAIGQRPRELGYASGYRRLFA